MCKFQGVPLPYLLYTSLQQQSGLDRLRFTSKPYRKCGPPLQFSLSLSFLILRDTHANFSQLCIRTIIPTHVCTFLSHSPCENSLVFRVEGFKPSDRAVFFLRFSYTQNSHAFSSRKKLLQFSNQNLSHRLSLYGDLIGGIGSIPTTTSQTHCDTTNTSTIHLWLLLTRKEINWETASRPCAPENSFH